MGNRVAGLPVIVGGVAAMASGLVALSLPERDLVACVLVGAVVMVALAVVGGVRGDRAARKAEGSQP